MKPVLPYLIFDGRCREAMTFYQERLGGDLHVMTYGESRGEAADAGDRLVHASLTSGAFVLMASDSPPGTPVTTGDAVQLMLGCDSDDEVARLYDRLAEGGTGLLAPHDTFWGAHFAMLRDRFGLHWMLSHERVGMGAAADG